MNPYPFVAATALWLAMSVPPLVLAGRWWSAAWAAVDAAALALVLRGEGRGG